MAECFLSNYPLPFIAVTIFDLQIEWYENHNQNIRLSKEYLSYQELTFCLKIEPQNSLVKRENPSYVLSVMRIEFLSLGVVLSMYLEAA